MLVKDVMTKKVILIREKATFREILQTFRKNKISGAPVVDAKNNLVGIVSEKDLLFKLFPSEKEFYKNIEFYQSVSQRENIFTGVKKLTAGKIMSKNVIYVDENDHVLTACAQLLIHNIRRLPVLRNGKIIGIVTTGNVFKNYLSHTVT